MSEGGKLVTLQDVSEAHWKKYGRNFFRWGPNRESRTSNLPRTHSSDAEVLNEAPRGALPPSSLILLPRLPSSDVAPSPQPL